MELIETTYIAASTQIKSVPGMLKGVVLSGGSAAGTIQLFDGTDATGKKLTPPIKAAINTSIVISLDGDAIPFSKLYAQISGTGAEAGIYYI